MSSGSFSTVCPFSNLTQRKRGREDPDGFELGRQVANLEVEIQAEVREATRVQAQRDAVQQQLDVMLERIQRKLDLYTELTGWSPSVVEETE